MEPDDHVSGGCGDGLAIGDLVDGRAIADPNLYQQPIAVRSHILRPVSSKTARARRVRAYDDLPVGERDLRPGVHNPPSGRIVRQIVAPALGMEADGRFQPPQGRLSRTSQIQMVAAIACGEQHSAVRTGDGGCGDPFKRRMGILKATLLIVFIFI